MKKYILLFTLASLYSKTYRQHNKPWSLIKKQILLMLTGMLCMPLAFSQPIIKMSGIPDSLTVKNQILLYLDQLDIRENVHLCVSFSADIPDEQAGLTYCVNPPAPNTYQVIRVWIDARLTKIRQRLVLAHEMIHVKQYAKGELIVVSKEEVLWKGQKYWYHGAEVQRDPWEFEAHLYDNHLAKLCKEQLEASLIASYPSRKDEYILSDK